MNAEFMTSTVSRLGFPELDTFDGGNKIYMFKVDLKFDYVDS